MIQAAFDAGGLDAICELFAQLEARVVGLTAHAAKLEARIAELEKRLNKNSSNSSKPPSSDGLRRKTQSLRPQNSGRKPGGQPGHPGQTLRQNVAPDFTVVIALVTYISTVRKQGLNLMDSIKGAFTGSPVSFTT